MLGRKLAVLVAAAMMLAAMVAISGPASAQGGCKEFGHNVVSEGTGFSSCGPIHSHFGFAKR